MDLTNDGSKQVWLTVRVRFRDKETAMHHLSGICDEMRIHTPGLPRSEMPAAFPAVLPLAVGPAGLQRSVGTATLGTPGGDEFEMAGH